MNAINASAASPLPTATAATPPAASTAPAGAAAIAAGSPAARTSTGFDATPVDTSAAGGGLGDALLSGVAKIAAFANKGMQSIEAAIQGDMTANEGTIDPAKMQQYSMKMSSYENMMQLAAKIQEKQDASIQVWLR